MDWNDDWDNRSDPAILRNKFKKPLTSLLEMVENLLPAEAERIVREVDLLPGNKFNAENWNRYIDRIITKQFPKP